LAKRAPGLTRQAAQAYWRGEHARLFAKLPALLSYVQNHAVLDDRGDPIAGDPGFDIFAEVEFAEEATLERVTASAHYRDVILADEKNLLDASQRTFLMTHRGVLAGAPRAGYPKVALFFTSGFSEPASSPDIRRWLADAAECAPYAFAASVNLVDRVGGTIPRRIDVVLQHYFRDLGDARKWYDAAQRRWSSRVSGQPCIVSGVIVVEHEIVARRAAEESAEAGS
jgi:hypothetical protein